MSYVRQLSLLPLVLLLGCDLFTPAPASSCDADDADCDGVPASEDCDDEDDTASPLLGERCDGVDNDCDGLVDEGFDEDEDGFTTCTGDCNDGDPTVFPGADEGCDDGVDNDCNGLIDDNDLDDGDGDGVCEDMDCNDDDPTIFPGADEICDEIDQDCDGETDEDFDGDADGVTSCGGDCDDADATVFPGATEVCDGEDTDCDGTPDSPLMAADADGDGVDSCQDGDCDDEDATVFPGAFEIPDGVDDDCDGVADEGWSGTGTAGLFTPTTDGGVILGSLGLVVSNAGDVNGDGISDWMAASPNHDVGRGRAYLFLGTSFDVETPPASLLPHATITGAEEGEELGSALALVDLDGDGWDDVVIGSPFGGPGSGPEGEVRIFWGGPALAPGAWAPDNADVSILGSYGVERCGAAVVHAGDMNDDTRPDLAIGCPWYTTSAGIVGRTAVFVGRTRAAWATAGGSDDAQMLILGQGTEENTGNSLAGNFDLDGDGRSDLAIGSPSWSGSRGRVGVKLGELFLPSEVELGDVDRVYSGQVFDDLGTWVGAGDITGDGKDELLIGAPGWSTNSGRLGVVLGGANPPPSGDAWARADWAFEGGTSAHVGLGGAVVDLSGDGMGDLVIPQPGLAGDIGGGQGQISLFLSPVATGTLMAADADATITGEGGGDAFGLTLIALPNGNGDGAEDLLVGAPYSDAGTNNGGRLTFIPGYP